MTASMLRGPETTGNTPASRRVRDVSSTIAWLDPSENPFTLLSKRAGGARTAKSEKFEFIEKEQAPRLTQVNGSQTSGDTAIEVTAGTGTYFYPGDVVQNLRTLEEFLVSSIATDTLTVVRGIGSVVGTAMNTLDDLMLIGTAFEERSSRPTERSSLEAYPFNVTQIFRTGFGASETQRARENYTGDEEAWLTKQNGIEHMKDIEFAFLFGQRNETTLNSRPLRLAGGFTYYATSNIVDAVSTLSESEFESLLQAVFQNTGGSASRTAFTSPGVISVIDMLALGRLQLVTGNDVYGLEVNQWRSSHGTVNLVKHRLLLSGTAGQGYAQQMFVVDLKKVAFVPLRTRDTKLYEHIEQNGDDGFEHEYKTEAGFEVRNPQLHGTLKNVAA